MQKKLNIGTILFYLSISTYILSMLLPCIYITLSTYDPILNVYDSNTYTRISISGFELFIFKAAETLETQWAYWAWLSNPIYIFVVICILRKYTFYIRDISISTLLIGLVALSLITHKGTDIVFSLSIGYYIWLLSFILLIASNYWKNKEDALKGIEIKPWYVYLLIGIYINVVLFVYF